MVDLIRELVNQAGSFLGIVLSLQFVMLVVILNWMQRITARQAGLRMLLVDKQKFTNSELISYGAVDDPRRVPTLKEMVS
jgi:hypothetical protein